jgi:hypothetical protein
MSFADVLHKLIDQTQGHNISQDEADALHSAVDEAEAVPAAPEAPAAEEPAPAAEDPNPVFTPEPGPEDVPADPTAPEVAP